MVTVNFSDRQAHHLLWLLADHLNRLMDDYVLSNAFMMLHDAYYAQSVIPLIPRDIVAAAEKCRAQERKDEPQLQMTRPEYEAFRLERQAEGARIDPENCEKFWTFAATIDPYGVLGIGTDDEYCTVGREYFVSRPDAKDWVHIGDLTDEARGKIWPPNTANNDAFEKLRALVEELKSPSGDSCNC